jgi:hypothetical protein
LFVAGLPEWISAGANTKTNGSVRAVNIVLNIFSSLLLARCENAQLEIELILTDRLQK